MAIFDLVIPASYRAYRGTLISISPRLSLRVTRSERPSYSSEAHSVRDRETPVARGSYESPANRSRDNCRSRRAWLLRPQRLHRLNRRGPARRDVTGEQRGGGQYRRDGEVSRRIQRTHLE